MVALLASRAWRMRFEAGGPARRRCHRRAAAGWRTCERRGARRRASDSATAAQALRRANALRCCSTRAVGTHIVRLKSVACHSSVPKTALVRFSTSPACTRPDASACEFATTSATTIPPSPRGSNTRPAHRDGEWGGQRWSQRRARGARRRGGTRRDTGPSAPSGWSRCSVSAYSRDTTRPKPEKSKSAPPGGPPGETAPAAGRTARRTSTLLPCSRAGSLRPQRPGGPARRGPKAPLHAGAAAAGAEPRLRLPPKAAAQPSAALAGRLAAIAPPRELPRLPLLLPCAPELLASAPERRARL
jgi:hypothetical protein